MKISLYQLDITWRDISKNRAKVEEWLNKIDPTTELAVLPEMFSTGFVCDSQDILSEQMQGETVQWLKTEAAKHNMAIATSLVITENDKLYNRFVFVHPSGQLEYSDKRHLFRMGGEDKMFSCGNTRKIVNYKGVRFLLQVCYDLRFPVWSRNQNDYDAIIYVANWPQVRINAWNTLLRARAIENVSYVIGCNRVGSDPTVVYNGNSVVVNHIGEMISTPSLNCEETVSAQINIEELRAFREKFPTWKDADEFELKF